MKIGIITEFTFSGLNYGNNLQTYALYHTIRKAIPECQVNVLLFSRFPKKKCYYSAVLAKKCYKIIRNVLKQNKIYEDFSALTGRKESFKKFHFQISGMTFDDTTWEVLQSSDYDMFIVGSDIVWAQDLYGINQIKFLDFPNTDHTRKIAYAASFGRDWIPSRYTGYIKKCLEQFDAISVREKSSIKLLESIGIYNAVHTLDPTLLYSKEEWISIEKKPEEKTLAPLNGEFLFAYILGSGEKQRSEIERICQANKLCLVTIPYAAGVSKVNADDEFGDIQLWNCSPQEWIWLIHHAKYVLTDSFHGIAFSTIFEKKFLAINRNSRKNINNRIIDYLDTISQTDKFVTLTSDIDLCDFQWNYEEISRILEEKREFSRCFLQNVFHKV